MLLRGQDTRGGIFSEALYRKKELMSVITTPFNFDPYLDNMNHRHKCIVVSRNELSISLELVFLTYFKITPTNTSINLNITLTEFFQIKEIKIQLKNYIP